MRWRWQLINVESQPHTFHFQIVNSNSTLDLLHACEFHTRNTPSFRLIPSNFVSSFFTCNLWAHFWYGFGHRLLCILRIANNQILYRNRIEPFCAMNYVHRRALWFKLFAHNEIMNDSHVWPKISIMQCIKIVYYDFFNDIQICFYYLVKWRSIAVVCDEQKQIIRTRFVCVLRWSR